MDLLRPRRGSGFVWGFVWEASGRRAAAREAESSRRFPAGRPGAAEGARRWQWARPSLPALRLHSWKLHVLPVTQQYFTPLVPLIKFSLSPRMHERHPHPWTLRSILIGAEAWDIFDIGWLSRIRFCSGEPGEVWSTVYICSGDWSCHRAEPFGNNPSDHLSETGS